jgi:hypothetical protein
LEIISAGLWQYLSMFSVKLNKTDPIPSWKVCFIHLLLHFICKNQVAFDSTHVRVHFIHGQFKIDRFSEFCHL